WNDGQLKMMQERERLTRRTAMIPFIFLSAKSASMWRKRMWSMKKSSLKKTKSEIRNMFQKMSGAKKRISMKWTTGTVKRGTGTPGATSTTMTGSFRGMTITEDNRA